MKYRTALPLVPLLLAALAVATCQPRDVDMTPTLNRGLGAEPESLDPHKGRSTQAAAVQRDIGEGLVGYTATGELVAAGAERWDISEDGTTYTFYLRPEAR